MTKHAYLPTTIVSDEGSVFMSQLIKELAEVLGITIEHDTIKHALTLGMLERRHAPLEKTLKIKTGERRSMWLEYVNIAVLNDNMFYHASIVCEHGRVFQGRIPYNVLHFKMGIHPPKTPTPCPQLAEDILVQTETIS